MKIIALTISLSVLSHKKQLVVFTYGEYGRFNVLDLDDLVIVLAYFTLK